MFLIKLSYYHDNVNNFKSFVFGKYNGFASKARGYCMHVFLVSMVISTKSNPVHCSLCGLMSQWFKTLQFHFTQSRGNCEMNKNDGEDTKSKCFHIITFFN